MSTNNKTLGPYYIVGGAGAKAPFGAATGTDMSTATITSAAVPCAEFDNIGIQASWSGTSPAGAITIQASLDYGAPLNAGSPTWTTLGAPTIPAVSGNTGSIYIELNQVSFPWLRVVYTKSAGTGTLTVAVSAKGL